MKTPPSIHTLLTPSVLLSWQGELFCDKPVCILGERSDPNRVVVEMTGSIRWTGAKGIILGVSMRRPRPCPDQGPLVTVSGGGNLKVCASVDIYMCVCVFFRYELRFCRFVCNYHLTGTTFNRRTIKTYLLQHAQGKNTLLPSPSLAPLILAFIYSHILLEYGKD